LLLVSHDREFLDNVVTSTFVLEGDGVVRQYPGGYEDYIKQRGEKAKVRGEGEQKTARSSEPSEPSKPSKPAKLSYNEKRELASLPDRIDALEKEIAVIEADLVAGKIYSSERLAPAQEELETAVERWAELAERDGNA